MNADAHGHLDSHTAVRRGRLLLMQGRAADAEQQLRLALSTNPQAADAHALLALALLNLQRFAEATDEAEQAVGIEPDEPSHHHVLGLTYLQRNRIPEAKAAAEAAVALDPEEADFWGLLSACAAETNDWREALEHADEGLAVDPEHERCRNYRAHALRNLGRHAEAAETLDGALRRRPDSAFTHANTGWNLLHTGGRDNTRQALEHFREALRLDPTNETARAGMVEALKARHLIYRLMLRFFLWMASLKPGARWGIILGAWLGGSLVRNLARSNPELGPVLWPIYGAYLVFVWMTWLAYPLFNLLLLFNKFGRHALSADQRRGAVVVGSCLLPALLLGVAWVATGSFGYAVAALMLMLLTIPASGVFVVPEGTPRLTMALVAGTLGLIGVGSVLVILWDELTDQPIPEPISDLASLVTLVYLAGVFLSQFLVNALAQYRPRL